MAPPKRAAEAFSPATIPGAAQHFGLGPLLHMLQGLLRAGFSGATWVFQRRSMLFTSFHRLEADFRSPLAFLMAAKSFTGQHMSSNFISSCGLGIAFNGLNRAGRVSGSCLAALRRVSAWSTPMRRCSILKRCDFVGGYLAPQWHLGAPRGFRGLG